ncbi:unnamed protein product [Blepharisma stoltei]|uniref:NADP-dependent oxidoreductase domain-containing protein n=1 Tax=Blepharisma stoltei TaxID=1481888 RepID=A0AAU9K1K5_9CILI|nr:unnamed protein product [Blepharisma stoltei]
MESEAMEYRYLGNSGLKISVLGFGNMTSGWSEGTEQWSFDCVDKCIRGGVNFFDTAEFYGMGVAETILGNNIKQGGWDRDDLVITTKFIPTKAVGIQGLSRKRLRQAINHSLKRLQLDYVDVLYLHRFDCEVPLEESIRIVNELIDDDKAFYWGTSEFNAQQLAECHAICEKHGWIHPIAEQVQYHMFERAEVERDYVPIYKEYGMGTTVWGPLAGGLLSGKYNDGNIQPGRFESGPFSQVYRQRFETYVGSRKEAAVKTLQGLKSLADELGCSQAQLALAWVIKNPDVTTAILGASSPAQLDGSLAAVEVMKKLTPEVLARIEDLLGNRPAPSMNWRNFTPNPPRR